MVSPVKWGDSVFRELAVPVYATEPSFVVSSLSEMHVKISETGKPQVEPFFLNHLQSRLPKSMLPISPFWSVWEHSNTSAEAPD